MEYRCYVSAGGLGDSVCGLYAAAGVAESLPVGDRLIFYTRHRQWFSRVNTKSKLILADHDDGADMGADMNSDYDVQLRSASSRKQWYTNNLTTILNLSVARPRAPDLFTSNDLVPGGLTQGRYIVLAPFSAWQSRNWPAVHYARLSLALQKSGWQVVAIDWHRKSLENTFSDTAAIYYWNMPPEWVLSLLSHAACVVGNDSGIAHVAALLGVPTVAVMAQLSPRLVFSHTDVQVITPQSICSPCSWQGSRGWSSSCDNIGCSALQSVSVEEVFHRIIALTRNGY